MLPTRRICTWLAALGLVGAAVTACAGAGATSDPAPSAAADPTGAAASADDPPSRVTLAFAGDVHFQLNLAALLDRPGAGLGPIDRSLSAADLTMVNLESAITTRGTPEAKELETPGDRYYFRTSSKALDVLQAAGVDVVSVANNHGADYGKVGIRDTLEADRNSPLAVVGIGRNRDEATAPHRITLDGTPFAFFAADASFREGASSVWSAGLATPGLAGARPGEIGALLRQVRRADARGEVVVVYLHWGEEMKSCPTAQQRRTAKRLASAGADVIVGAHAHVLLGSGWLGQTYVSYGLGNFLWYHNHQPDTGVLSLRFRDGEVVDDAWTPARIGLYGKPVPLAGRSRTEAIDDWEALRGCAGLAPSPS